MALPSGWSISVDDRKAIRSLELMGDPRNIATALLAGGVFLKAAISPYPPSVAHPPQPFKTDKQRRYVMMAIRQGLIEVPYKRGGLNSQDLGQKWRISQRDGGMTVVVSNNAGYAGVVVGPKRVQSLYMRKLGWRAMEDEIKKHSAGTSKAITKQLEKSLKGRV